MLLFVSGILWGNLDNIPLVATFIPVVEIIGVSTTPEAIQPIWWSLALGSCLGGNGTLVGASANVIMFGFAKKNRIPLSFTGYLIYGIPLTLLSLGISYVYVRCGIIDHDAKNPRMTSRSPIKYTVQSGDPGGSSLRTRHK